jgi:organic radical activating enzyme
MNKGDESDVNFKSKFLSDAELMQQRLNKVSPSMCLAKWKQVSLHLPTGHTNSCYHPPLHKIQQSDLQNSRSGLHNTAYKKSQRKLMLEGVRPKECSYCWAIEDSGQLSDRSYRSGEPWAAKDFDTIITSDSLKDINPSYVEVNFNNVCNLKCSYCSPQFSSSWMQESKASGAYPTKKPHNAPEYFTGERRPIPNREHNPYVESFWEWWPELYPELEHFRMTGGEPIMDKNTYRVFDYVLDNPKPNLHLSTTSNFSVEQKLWEKYKVYLQKLCNTPDTLEHFMQYVSVDGWGKPAEYMRNGLNFDLMWDRVTEYLVDVPERNSLTFIITMNNLSVTSLKTLLENILKLRQTHSKTYQRIWFDTPLLRQPTWQSLQLLPASYVSYMQSILEFMKSNMETEATRFHGFKDYEVQRMQRDITWMSKGSELDLDYQKQNRADFYRFFTEHDTRRNTNFKATFPEMIDWWKECKYHADNT